MLSATPVIGGALAVLIAALAWRLHALSGSGAVAAAILGTVAMAAGWSWGVVLVVYFISSAALSRFRAREKERRTGDLIEKGHRRDAVQVIANGGAFGVAAAAFALSPSAAWPAFGAGALAASAADTWATEIGTLSRKAPRSVLTHAAVPPGTSGGVTLLGTGAALAGASVVAATARSLGWPVAALAGGVAGGFLGCLLDSVLGATLQCRRWCDHCRAHTERNVHRCGARTSVIGGLPWLDNDGVNALATLAGGVIALLVARAL